MTATSRAYDESISLFYSNLFIHLLIYLFLFYQNIYEGYVIYLIVKTFAQQSIYLLLWFVQDDNVVIWLRSELLNSFSHRIIKNRIRFTNHKFCWSLCGNCDTALLQGWLIYIYIYYISFIPFYVNIKYYVKATVSYTS